jgi:glycosyltransferase involved in cell wall biosynthesis
MLPVSVVLTTFNRSALLPRSIASVLAQTHNDFELIVVDDCSTDATQEALARIDDPRMRVVRHERNLGVSMARNTGVAAATGAFVCFQDDDDEWLPDRLAVGLDVITRQPDPDNVLLYSQIIVDDGISSNVLPTRGLRPGERLCEYLMCGEGLLHPNTVMIARPLIASTPFPTQGISRLEDQNVWLALEEKDVTFVFVERAVAVWHADLERSRMTNADQYLERSIEWLDQFGPRVTKKARRGFLAHAVAPYLGRTHTLFVVRTIVVAVATRALPIRVGLRTLAKALLPHSAVVSLRRVFPRSRFG